jgi:hypothetical protein
MHCGRGVIRTLVLIALAWPFCARADDPGILIDTGGLLRNATRLSSGAAKKDQSTCGVVTGHFSSVTGADGSQIEVPPPLPTYQVSLGDRFKLVTEPDVTTQRLHKVGVLSLEFSLSGITYQSDSSSDTLVQILPDGAGGQLLAKNLIGSNRARQNFWIAWRCPIGSQSPSGLPRFHLIARKAPCRGGICPSGFMISAMIEEQTGLHYQLLRPSLISPNDKDAADFAAGKIAYVVDAFVDPVPASTAGPKTDPVVIPFRIVGRESRTDVGRVAP